MRYWFLIPLFFAASACSTNIYMSGEHAKFLRSGTPRKVVIAELGKPASTSATSQSSGERRARADIYLTSARIPDRASAMAAGMAAGLTLGLSEIVFVPYALISHNIPRQKCLMIDYDHAGRLIDYRLRKPARP